MNTFRGPIALWVAICATAFGVGYALPVQTATPAQIAEIGEAWAEVRDATSEEEAEIDAHTRAHANDPAEDEEGFDCRIHGNHECGVQDPNTGEWVIVGFDHDGKPLYFYPHPNPPVG